VETVAGEPEFSPPSHAARASAKTANSERKGGAVLGTRASVLSTRSLERSGELARAVDELAVPALGAGRLAGAHTWPQDEDGQALGHRPCRADGRDPGDNPARQPSQYAGYSRFHSRQPAAVRQAGALPCGCLDGFPDGAAHHQRGFERASEVPVRSGAPVWSRR
jgi:hypothetical protein